MCKRVGEGYWEANQWASRLCLDAQGVGVIQQHRSQGIVPGRERRGWRESFGVGPGSEVSEVRHSTRPVRRSGHVTDATCQSCEEVQEAVGQSCGMPVCGMTRCSCCGEAVVAQLLWRSCAAHISTTRSCHDDRRRWGWTGGPSASPGGGTTVWNDRYTCVAQLCGAAVWRSCVAQLYHT